MRFALLVALAGCNPGIAPQQDGRNQVVPARNQVTPSPQAPGNDAAVASANIVQEAPPSPPQATPGLAEMSPYRRREYERGWRDCMTGNFDRERQGESYRIGCMAAEDARERAKGGRGQ